MYSSKEYLRVAKSSLKASELLNRTVVKLNEDALSEAFEIIQKNNRVITLGVKNTGQIDRKLIKNLIDCKKYVWHTIDGMSEGGRAVDINLINPVTLRPMTGSSSATAINVLYGINDVGIGTDGGGSVLAPAISLNLYSIMAKGMGLRGNMDKTSTDGISFIPGIGVISHSLELARDTILGMLGIEDNNTGFDNINIVVLIDNNAAHPKRSNMNGKLTLVSNRLRENGIYVHEGELPDLKNRKESISKMTELLSKFNIVITCEGPVDLEGLGDSVFGTMGELAGECQDKSGKYMVKIANMLDATSVSVPCSEISSGIVITAPSGVGEGITAIKLAEEIKDLFGMPELYYDYFKNGHLRRKRDLIFSLEGV